MNVLVSIAIATYNGEQYLEEQLDSIYNQTYKNFEVIVSDDRSEDLTVEILKKYQQKFGLAYTINKVRLGVTKNFENAVSKCQGKYILLSDQDDIWLPEKIESMLNNIGSASLIYSDGLIIENNDQEIKRKLSNEKWLKPFGIDSSDKDFFKYVLLNSFILGCSIMFDREILEEAIPFHENELNHDWWLLVCAMNQKGIKYLDKVLFKYRIHSNNFSLIEARKRKNIITRFLNNYSAEAIAKRKAKKLILYKVINNLQKSFDSKFLKEINIYSKSKKKVLNIKGFYIVLKYNNFFYPRAPTSTKIFLILTNLIR